MLGLPSTSAPTPNNDLVLASDTQNDRAPHLAAYGSVGYVAPGSSTTKIKILRIMACQ